MSAPPKKIVDILRAIEDENNVGAFSIEVNLRPELLGTVTNLVREYFYTYGGDFHDLTSSEEFIKSLPNDISFERAEVSSSSLRLGPEDGRIRKFIYRPVQNQTKAFLEITSENNTQTDIIPLSDLDQSTFSILASIYAAPLVSIIKGRKKIGIIFDGSTIDVENWERSRDYLSEICISDGLSVFLLIFTGKPGSIEAMHSEKVGRIGIYTSGEFRKINSYSRSIEIIRGMITSLKSADPRIPLVLFPGAGASIEAGMPPTRQLMTEAICRLLGKPDMLGVDFEELQKAFRDKIVSESLYLPGEDRNNLQVTFERIMSEELRFCEHLTESPTLNHLKNIISKTSPSNAHYNISSLVKSNFRPILLTSNYDDLIERCLDKYEIFYEDAQFTKARDAIQNYLQRDASCPVFKFHGSIHNFDSIKASVQDTRALEVNKHSFLASICNGSLFREIIPRFDASAVRVVFIGYGFNDQDITNVLQSVLASEHRLHCFVVNPNPSRNSLSFLDMACRKSRSENHMSNLISIPFLKFSSELIGTGGLTSR